MRDLTASKSRKYFARLAWALLAYNIPVILWGAYVRVSFSGDGCGAHWPFCNGQVIPQHMAAPMAIEFTHRVMTSVDTIATIAMCVWAFLAFPRGDRVRRYSVLSLVFLLIEALLGAGLVLLRYVAKDQSAGRAWYLSAHLTNTMLLLAVLTITAWLAGRRWPATGALLLPDRFRSDSSSVAGSRLFRNAPRMLLGTLGVTIVVSITGAIAALGDTLFPSSSVVSGIQQDFAQSSSVLLRLRLFHPLIAIAGATYIVVAVVKLLHRADEADTRSAAARVLTLTLFQLAIGAVNITLLAPVWMQLIHLLIADVLWISLVLLALEAGTTVQRPMAAAHAVGS